MTQTRRFILFELNEVPTRVVHHYAGQHPGSAFAKVLAEGSEWRTITPDTGHLSPWITWPTLHRGVSSEQHQIVALGQDVAEVDRLFPPVWALLREAGKRVGLFGSLHSYPLPRNAASYDFYVPDTFAAGPETVPAKLSAFQQFNLRMVDRSGRNVSTGVPAREALAFLGQAVRSGLRAGTVAKVARQLAVERIARHRVGRRRTVQSLLAFDLFIAQLKEKQPDAAFFFTNHVASSMHRYWPATFTGDYKATKWSDAWVRRFSREIDYTMGEADRMLGELIEFANQHRDYVVLVTGSMGQAAVDSAEKQTKTEVLVRDLTKFMKQLDANGWHRRRTMEPTYTVAFDEATDAARFFAACLAVKIAGEPLQHRRIDERSVEFVLGHKNIVDDQLTVTVANRAIEPADAGLENVSIDDEVGSAAYHTREGMLLVYDPRDRIEGSLKEPISTTRIAPTLLALVGVRPPSYMEGPIEQLFGTAARGASSKSPDERCLTDLASA